MASNASNFSIKMFKMFQALSRKHRILIPTVCMACGSAVIYYSSVKSKQLSTFWSRFVKPREVLAATHEHQHYQKNTLSDVSYSVVLLNAYQGAFNIMFQPVFMSSLAITTNQINSFIILAVLRRSA